MDSNIKIVVIGALLGYAFMESRKTPLVTTFSDGGYNPGVDDYIAPAGDVAEPSSFYDPWDDWLAQAEPDTAPIITDDLTDTGNDMTDGVDKSNTDDVILAAGGDRSYANLASFLKILRVLESNDNYGAIVGGGQVTDYREHPWVLNPARPAPAGFNSNASGAYQFIAAAQFAGDKPGKKRTWEMARDAAGVRDFSPRSQDLAAIEILKFPWRNAYNDVLAGRFHTALSKLVDEWESIKLVLQGKYPYTLADVRSIYSTAGGAIVDSTTVV